MKQIAFKKSILFEALLAASLLINLISSQQVQSSSYVDDYFLPSAKYALQKISQSLGPVASGSVAGEQVPPVPPLAAGGELNSSSEDARVREPNKSEYVKLEVGGAPAPLEPDKTPASSLPVSREEEEASTSSTLVLSSSEATQTLEPSLASSEPSPTGSGGGEAGEQSSSARAPEAGAREEPASTREPGEGPEQQSPPEQPATSGEHPTLVVASAESSGRRPSEQAIQETELNALAAVDASINFGEASLSGASDSCYDEYGNARFCEPEFENVAFGKQVEVSSECGKPASRFCTAQLNERNEQLRNCHICDAQHPKRSHPAAYLTDSEQAGSATCWVSAPIASGPENNETKGDNVSLTLSFGKSYEITYLSLQFCSLKPDSLAIYKSSDFGLTWHAYQFYSSLCQRLYGRPQARASRGGPLEASCLNATGGSGPTSSGRIAFVTQEQRAGSSPGQPQSAAEASALQDWVTATNIRVVLDRHQASWLQALKQRSGPPLEPAERARQRAEDKSNATSELPADSLTKFSDTFNYAISDFVVGGRCKCNGHGSRCLHSAPEGELHCECWHNTAGRDCERCAPFHFDRPWQPASQQEANPCQPCNCNGHSRKCKFDPGLYKLSGNRSGGVCLRCQHNTDGRHCHYCKEGYTRDHSKLMSDKEACKPCDCHPLGSIGSACNQTTGQCPCKEGVTGLQCSRCAPGYQQSNSASEPCIKLPENDINSQLASNGIEDSHQPEDQGQSGSGNGNNDQPQVSLIPEDSEQPRRGYPNEILYQPLEGKPDGQADLAAVGELAPFNRRLARPSAQAGHWQSAASQKHKPNQRNSLYHNFRPASHFARLPEQEGAPPGELVNLYEYPQELNQNGYYDSAGRLYLPPSYYGDLPPRYASADWHRRPIPLPASSGDLADEQQAHPYENPTTYNQIFLSHARGSQMAPGRALTARHHFNPEPANEQAGEQAACGDCQPPTKRLNSRQFCHLDFAVKAAVLNREVAEDWTRVEVELKDVFKSPQASQLAGQHSNKISRAAGFLADEPLEQAGSQRSNRTSEGAEGAPVHRLKVGTIQSIWIPTEDLTCGCPKLRVSATYLIMGLLDTKENSANSLQLDRHGVAIEWKSSLQSKLMVAQRRHARGKC